MNRRDLFRLGGKAAVAVPLLSASQIVELGKPEPKLLPPVHAGTAMTASTFNQIIDAINELRAGR